MKPRILLCALLAFLALPPAASARPKFWVVRLKDRGTIFGFVSGGFGVPRLNDRLEVVMPAYSTPPRSGIWSNGSLMRPPLPAGLDDLIPFGINNQTEICGYTFYGFHQHGFVSDLFSTIELPLFDSTHYLSGNLLLCLQGQAHGINDAGLVSGWLGRKIANENRFEKRPVVWQGGVPTVQGTLPGYPLDSVGYDRPVYINASGQIAGTAVLTTAAQSGQHRAYIGNFGYLVELPQLPGGRYSFAYDLSDAGHVVGQGYDSVASGQHQHAFLYHEGTIKDIHGTVYGASAKSVAWGVNASGHAVGAFQSTTGANINALYFDGDSTYALGTLIVNPPGSVGGPPFQNFWVATDINNAGAIVGLYTWSSIDYPCLLWPYYDGVVVNSEGDLPDQDPGDGKCWTGGYNSLGQEECTMRAALQHTNLTVAGDSIKFSIPTGGIPSITVATALPAVEESAVIDATTQPGTHRVRLNGAGLASPGIVIAAGGSEIRGLTVNGFDGPGILLTGGDSNRLVQNVIGPDTAGTHGLGNYSGIEIDGSSHNEIGDPDGALANDISFNRYSGIRVRSGEGNLIRRNRVFENGELGIDLGQIGVTLNDSLDSDGGANRLVNYPYIDSVVQAFGQTHVYGHVMGEPDIGYVVEFFVNDSCDFSGFGEGQRSVWTEQVTAGAAGTAQFSASFGPIEDSGKCWTATATDFDGNTSEFSRAWPFKMLRVVDGRDDPVDSRQFILSRVAFDPPMYTETLLDTVTTDPRGLVDVSEMLRTGDLKLGDSIRLYRLLQTSPPPPPEAAAAAADGRGYSVRVDNARFDSLDFRMYFDEVDLAAIQTIRLGHTEIGFTIRVFVEWDADPSYLTQVEEAVRGMANYLYDVGDGQIRIDTAFILDNETPFLFAAPRADIFIRASNIQSPDLIGWEALPRRWTGSVEESKQVSLEEKPLNPADPWHFRAMAKHFGLDVLGLGHESTPFLFSCAPADDLGFMRDPSPSFRASHSEMSWERQYAQTGCTNTQQYLIHHRSCWETFEAYEGDYDSVYCDIVSPSERTLASEADFFEGPNDGPTLQVDVGRLVVFPNAKDPRTKSDELVQVYVEVSPGPGGTVLVRDGLIESWEPEHPEWKILQGETNDSGLIVLMGVSNLSHWSETARLGSLFPVIPRPYPAALDYTPWISGQGTLGTPSGDTTRLEAFLVRGDHRMIHTASLSPSAASLGLSFGNPLLSAPYALVRDFAGRFDSLVFTTGPGSYALDLSTDSLHAGFVRVHAADDSSKPLFFDIEYLLADSIGRAATTLAPSAANGSWFAVKDTLDFALATYTDYPGLSDGLDPSSVPVSGHLALATSLGAALGAGDSVILAYRDDVLPSDSTAYASESSIHVFFWDAATGQWQDVGGAVDTVMNLVRAPIALPGTYAAFTTGVLTEVRGDVDPLVPARFEIAQNYPNPFNPSTSIEYSVPVRTMVTLDVFNILGQRVRELVNEVRPAGAHRVDWNGTDDAGNPVVTGVYLYRFRAGGVALTKKMLLIR